MLLGIPKYIYIMDSISILIMKIEHAQTVLTVDDIESLKYYTGQTTTKDALAEAVYDYLRRARLRKPK